MFWLPFEGAVVEPGVVGPSIGPNPSTLVSGCAGSGEDGDWAVSDGGAICLEWRLASSFVPASPPLAGTSFEYASAWIVRSCRLTRSLHGQVLVSITSQRSWISSSSLPGISFATKLTGIRSLPVVGELVARAVLASLEDFGAVWASVHSSDHLVGRLLGGKGVK